MVDAGLPVSIIRTNVGDIAQGRYFYDFLGDGDNQSYEKLFGLLETELAAAFATIEAKIELDQPLDHSDKSSLINFMKLQLIRSDHARSLISRELISDLFKEEYHDRADKLIHAYLMHRSLFEDDFYSEVLNYLSNYEIKVLKSHKEIDIYTSSYPTFFHSNGQLEMILEHLKRATSKKFPQINSNLFFPFSSKACLYFYNPNSRIEFDLSDWEHVCITTGLSSAGQRIYFKCSENSVQFFPLLKSLLKPLKNSQK